MDAIEVVSVIFASAIMLAMLGMAARRSWLERQETNTQHRADAMAA